jgi:hypothetical protein
MDIPSSKLHKDLELQQKKIIKKCIKLEFKYDIFESFVMVDVDLINFFSSSSLSISSKSLILVSGSSFIDLFCVYSWEDATKKGWPKSTSS